jgi:hypothetical protein
MNDSVCQINFEPDRIACDVFGFIGLYVYFFLWKQLNLTDKMFPYGIDRNQAVILTIYA